MYAGEKLGCYELGRQYARPLNLKLAVNPTVVIRCPGSNLSQQEAYQMCGRGVRD